MHLLNSFEKFVHYKQKTCEKLSRDKSEVEKCPISFPAVTRYKITGGFFPQQFKNIAVMDYLDKIYKSPQKINKNRKLFIVVFVPCMSFQKVLALAMATLRTEAYLKPFKAAKPKIFRDFSKLN